MTVPRHLQWLRRRSQGRFELRLAVLVFVLLARSQLVLVAHAQVPAQAARYRAELVRAAHSQWGWMRPWRRWPRRCTRRAAGDPMR